MADKSGMASLSEIVYSVIADMGENTTHNFDKYLKWAYQAYQDFRYDMAGEIKSVMLPMNDYFAVDAPEDMIDWTKIGKRVGDKIRVFGVNDNITFYHDKDECGNILANEPTSVNNIPVNWSGGYWFGNLINEYGEFVGGLFGYGGAHNSLGYFRYNSQARQFQFDSRVAKGDVLLEYLSSGVNPNQNTVVTRYAQSAIMAYVHWQRFRFDRNYGPANGHTQVMKDEYYNELRKLQARLNGLSVRDVLDATRRYYMMSPKN